MRHTIRDLFIVVKERVCFHDNMDDDYFVQSSKGIEGGGGGGREGTGGFEIAPFQQTNC